MLKQFGQYFIETSKIRAIKIIESGYCEDVFVATIYLSNSGSNEVRHSDVKADVEIYLNALVDGLNSNGEHFKIFPNDVAINLRYLEKIGWYQSGNKYHVSVDAGGFDNYFIVAKFETKDEVQAYLAKIVDEINAEKVI